MENFAGTQANEDLNSSLKLAMALAIAKSRRLPTITNTDSQSESDVAKWKRKAKQRKEEIIRLQEDLKLAEGNGAQHDLFPLNAACKCYFYDNLGHQVPWREQNHSKINDVLRRRFLRQVRLSERKRRSDGSLKQSCVSDSAIKNELEQLKASADFLVDLCQTAPPPDDWGAKFKNWSHQAIDFILATLESLSSSGKIDEKVERIVSNLIVRLLQRMCNGLQNDDPHPPHHEGDFQSQVQHLIRNLGSDAYVGQRVILSVSQRTAVVAETLLFMDPFDAAFPKLHDCMYLMIQLIEFLVSDYLLSWSDRQDLDLKLLEEWLISVFRAKRALEMLEDRNALYILYMDRVAGCLTRLLGQASFHQKLPPEVVANLLG